MGEPHSIVQWFPDKNAQKCGYCNNSSGSVQNGMWAQSLTVNDYQYLIDRGWRRSGQYCYKPVMHETCCPLYTIKCNALNFRPSKSQKKVIKKMNKFLHIGMLKNLDDQKVSEESIIQGQCFLDNYRECPNKNIGLNFLSQIGSNSDDYCGMNEEVNLQVKKESISAVPTVGESNDKYDSGSSSKEKYFKKGVGADPNKPPCIKAKLMRLENRLKKKGHSSKSMTDSSNFELGKSLEDFMNETSVDDKLQLKTKLIEPSYSLEEWKTYEQLEFDLFKKYQMIIHNDPPYKNTLEGFLRFLVNTPLKKQGSIGSKLSAANPTYGSYHQQYWLDDKLIAVGVIDILPKCVSAVYFFYDPDYRELTLGTFGALKEIQLARELYPTLNTEFYYMGFYIHTCKKMKYKGNMNPSFLLCPETYKWFPIEKCLQKLESAKYIRFNEDPDATDVDESSPQHLDNMKIVLGNRYMTYKRYKNHFSKQDNFTNVGKLIGRKCVENIIFFEP
ncbi:hypothetical protein WA026_001342 [Henosepilachna vigintioctopunctata]|uniref:Arginyl-tRNA--protein transferase 1 n=1 Tax=Henosepilachna vigintioctopunctata TaxID=420089 RepID=A0AAW1UJE0_9CUCU